jgi:hypothetical protein
MNLLWLSPLIHCSQSLKMPWVATAPCVQDPKYLRLHQQSLSQDGVLPQFSEVWKMKGCFVCCWIDVLGKSLFHKILALGLGFAGGVVFVPQLGLPVCGGDHLAYFEVEGSTSSSSVGTEGGSRTGVTNCFSIYPIVFLFHWIFQLSVLFLSFALLYVVSSLLSRFLFMGPNESPCPPLTNTLKKFYILY